MTSIPSTLGTYPVERELGRGGMGVVYLARDPRLNRQVAIKVLPDMLTLNPDNLARFDREAKLLASLNHPNIAAIYGIEIDDASRQQLLVLEYVSGDTLAVRISRGALPIDEALDVCRQIALAIEAAHEGGVIHRDLKPGNVKVTPDGVVKVLDFGLAKGGGASSASGGGAGGSALATMTSPAMTAMGIILGTAGYMSPEQARGKVVDKRTDIWSFGCVFYECLTGREPFGGETVSDAIAKILEREPDWSALPPSTPPRIRELLRRCLERDLKKRQRDIGDVRIEIEEAIAARASSSRGAASIAPPSARGWLSPRMIALATVCVLIGAAAGVGLWTRLGPGAGASSALAGPRRASFEIPRTLRGLYATFTVDGRSVLIAGNPRRPDGTEDPRARIYTRRLDDYEFKQIPGTEGAQSFTTSPNGRWLAVVATISETSAKRRLLKVPVDGSAPPVTIADWSDTWSKEIEWLEDDDLVILVDGQTKFVRQPSRGGPATPPMAIETGGTSGYLTLVNRLPGDRGVFLSMETWGPRGFQFNQWVMDPKTGKAHRVLENSAAPAYASTGHLIFQRADVLMAALFDLDTLAVTGDVTAVFAGVRGPDGGFSLASDGTLIYSPGGLLGTDRRIVTVDAKGTVAPFIAERREYENEMATSRDGRKIAVVVPTDKGTYEIWLGDLDRPGLKRLVALPNADCAEPVWSPDGQRIAYMRMGSDDDDGVYLQRVDGAGPPELLAKTGSREVKLTPTSWRPDGSGLLMTKRSNGRNAIVFVPVPAAGAPGALRVLRNVNYSEHGARVSPDGRLVAFASYESGKSEVYVASYGADGSFGPHLLVSSGGGGDPEWASDSRLFYFKGPDTLMSASIASKPALSASVPVATHDLRKLRLRSSAWGFLPDGRLIATQKGEGEDDVTSYNLVFNWFEELRAKMGKK